MHYGQVGKKEEKGMGSWGDSSSRPGAVQWDYSPHSRIISEVSFFFSVYWFGHSSWLLSAAPQPAFCFFQAISRSGASTLQQQLSGKHNRKKSHVWVLTPGKNNYLWHRLSLHASNRHPCSFCSCSSTSASSWSVFHTRLQSLTKTQGSQHDGDLYGHSWNMKGKIAHLRNVVHGRRLGGVTFIVIMSRSTNNTAGGKLKRL